jgi:cell division protein FtsQ
VTRSRRSRNRKKRQLRVPQVPTVRLPRIRVNWTAVLLPPFAVAAAFAGAAALDVLLDRAVERLVIEGTFQRVTPVQIEAALAPELVDGFLSLDLEHLRRRVQALAWVDTVRLRRVWPDALIVHVTEHRAAARWGDTGLMNERGELFAERPVHAFPELPKLVGPAGSERDVASFYLALREPLDAAHLEMESLTMDERGAWRLTLGTGQEVRLGRRDVEQRAARFFSVAAPALANELNRIDYVDLRYTNGFAVGWLGEDEVPETDVATRREESPGHG